MDKLKSIFSLNNVIMLGAISYIASNFSKALKWLFIVYLKNYCVGVTTSTENETSALYNYLLENTNGRSNKLLNNNKVIYLSKEYLDFGAFHIKLKGRYVFLWSWKEISMNEKGFTQFISLYIIGRKRQELILEIYNRIQIGYLHNSVAKIHNMYGDKNVIIPYEEIYDKCFGESSKKVFDYLDKWITSENIYKECGKMYKCGILLYGQAGTGKSSIVAKIAKKYNIHRIYYINNHILDEETHYIPNYTYNGNKAIYVMEEIDKLLDNENKSKIENDIMQFLDGTYSIPNSIIIMTTNHKEKLNDILIRVGRVDLMVDMLPLTENEVKDMFEYFDVRFKKDELKSYNQAYLQQYIIEYKMKKKGEIVWKKY